eukprot:scaffold19525_cov68-Cyclotella_meneghiniana.AAC.9
MGVRFLGGTRITYTYVLRMTQCRHDADKVQTTADKCADTTQTTADNNRLHVQTNCDTKQHTLGTYTHYTHRTPPIKHE